MDQALILAISLFTVIQGASLSTKYAEKLAEGLKMSRYVVGFIIVTFVSILPETIIAISAALQGDPSFGVGTIMGSNVADLTLAFALITFAVRGGKGLKVEKNLAKKLLAYPLFIAVPMVLGLDGSYTRTEGITLIIIGVIFYIYVFNQAVNISGHRDPEDRRHKWRNASLLLFSMGLLLAGAHYTVESATSLAQMIGINPILIGILIVGLGTIIPEISFSLKAVRDRKTSLAVGDLMGTVLADATIVVGLVALIQPFDFPVRIAYVAGIFMFVASVVLVFFIRTNYRIGRREALALALLWLIYIVFELLINDLPVLAMFQ